MDHLDHIMKIKLARLTMSIAPDAIIPWKRQEPALELMTCYLRYQLQKWWQK